MKNFGALLIGLLPLFSAAQKNIPAGEGLLKIDFVQLPALQFYADTNDTAPAKTIHLTKNQSGEYAIENQAEAATWFKPEQLFFEYDIFLIRVDTTTGEWYKVIINAETGATLWTKAATEKHFIKWPTFLLKEISSVDKGDFNLPIKTAANEKAATIKKMESSDCFKVLEVKGDWIKIKTNTEMECSESKHPVTSGWIRWRQHNRVTIGYSLTS